jgi:hypothetical protein
MMWALVGERISRWILVFVEVTLEAGTSCFDSVCSWLFWGTILVSGVAAKSKVATIAISCHF